MTMPTLLLPRDRRHARRRRTVVPVIAAQYLAELRDLSLCGLGLTRWEIVSFGDFDLRPGQRVAVRLPLDGTFDGRLEFAVPATFAEAITVEIVRSGPDGLFGARFLAPSSQQRRLISAVLARGG